MASLQSAKSRVGFTLIEILVVLLIIALIASLLAMAVTKALGAGRRAANRVEISQLETALEQFKQRFGRYPPSYLKLAEVANVTNYPNYATPGTLDSDSVGFLTSIFPNMASTWQTTGIDWNENGQIDPQWVVTLEGDQCLVFFLGGMPALSGTQPDCLGFSANPRNPADLTSASRVGPFYDFASSRLVILQPPANSPRSRIHYSYLDKYGSSDGQANLIGGQPIAYFSSYGVKNGYNRYFSAPGNPFSDCSILGVWPYAETTLGSNLGIKYQRQETYQIVSAGADGLFGQGSVPMQVNANGAIVVCAPYWNAVIAPTIYPDVSPGHDDQSNFTSGLLGAGQD